GMPHVYYGLLVQLSQAPHRPGPAPGPPHGGASRPPAGRSVNTAPRTLPRQIPTQFDQQLLTMCDVMRHQDGIEPS
ncbi:hypothetical protein ACWCPH_25310, partial [Streptomyces zhihengii]